MTTLLMFCSAGMFCLPFIWSKTYLLFYLSIPVLYLSLTRTTLYSFTSLWFAAAWAALIQVGVSSWLIYSLYLYTCLSDLLLIIAAITFTACIIGCCWWYMIIQEEPLSLHSTIYNSIITLLFFFILIQCQFFYTGSCEGNPFINPLLPLVMAHKWMPGVWANKSIGCLVWIYLYSLISWLFIYCFQKNNTSTLLLLTTIYFWPSYNYYQHLHQDHHIIYMQNIENIKYQHLYQAQMHLYQITKQTIHKYQKEKQKLPYCIILPESVYPDYITQDVVDRFSTILDDHCYLIIGAKYKHHTSLYNAVYIISTKGIEHILYKQHYVACVEKPIHAYSISTNPYNPFYTPNLLGTQPITWNFNTISYQFLICSELYYGLFTPCRTIISSPHAKVLFIQNNSWLSLCYVKRLAQALQALYACAYNVEIINR